jgi:hypothetical protein
VLDDLAVYGLRRRLIEDLALARGVDLAEGAAHALISERSLAAALPAAASALARAALRGARRRMLTAMLVARAVDEGVLTFRLGTLFDHYAARLHVGGPLDAGHAASIRKLAFEGHESLEPLARALGAVVRGSFKAVVRTPGQIMRAVRRLGRRNKEVVDFGAAPIEGAVGLVDAELGKAGNAHVQRMIAEFEAAYRRLPRREP